MTKPIFSFRKLFIARILAVVACLSWAGFSGYAQHCPTPAFQPSSQPGVIDWNKFPEFSLPFTIVYGGPRLNDSQQTPLKKGFSHLASFTNYDSQLPRNKRALLWYGTATGINQPWDVLKSPWANNQAAYESKWASDLRSFANMFEDSRGKAFPETDILMADIERHYNTNDSMLSLKRRNLVPAPYLQLSDEQFLIRYKRDMQNQYAAPFSHMRKNGLSGSTKLTSYADVPIRNTFLNIDGNSWQSWVSNPELVHFLTRDSLSGTVGGSLYPQLDFLLPSAYYQYEYPSPYAGNYLSYLLFQIEANRAWSSKPIVPIVWMRYTGSSINTKIQPWMAEATAIFPFLAGANGLWLWESPGNTGAGESLAVYEYFIHGLHRLSAFKEFFDGGIPVQEKSARDHFADQDAIWRGIVKGNRILIAAQNPYAADGATTTVSVTYGGWKQPITLTGKEIILCTYDLPETAQEVLTVTPSPNPSSASVSLQLFSSRNRNLQIQLVSAGGQILFNQSASISAGPSRLPLQTGTLAAGMYLVRIWDDTTATTERILIR